MVNVLDIATLAIFVLSLIICIWKGFLKIILKFGALAIAVILARFFGSAIGGTFFSKLDESLATVIGTVIVFVIFYVVLRLIFAVIRKAVTSAQGVGAADRILGAVLGIIIAFSTVFLLAEILRIAVAVASMFDAQPSLLDAIEDTRLFRIFF